jgi:2-haloacid dehalogenase
VTTRTDPGVRWATFDCYGTLIDWESGLRSGLAQVFGEGDAERLLARYHEIEPRIQADDPARSYREVMAGVLAELAAEERRELAEGERDMLGRSLPGWPAFPEVPGALAEAGDRGWRLVILSNTDRDFIEASMRQIGIEFELAVVASEIGSYKPAHGHWHAFYERTGADPATHVHVAASLFHDIEPTRELGIPSVWINRLGETTGLAPARELPDLRGLPDALDELVTP